MVAIKIVKHPIEVGNRLEELHLTRDHILDVVDAMVSAKADCTPNDPAGAAGWSSWRMGIRRLREVLGTEDEWERDEIDQIPGVINKALGIRSHDRKYRRCDGTRTKGSPPAKLVEEGRCH